MTSADTPPWVQARASAQGALASATGAIAAASAGAPPMLQPFVTSAAQGGQKAAVSSAQGRTPGLRSGSSVPSGTMPSSICRVSVCSRMTSQP